MSERPLRCVAWLFVLLPLWWALGLEQFVWPVGLLGIALFRYGAMGTLPKLVPVARWLGVFLVVHLISGFFIVENIRYITFARNISTYVSAFLLVVLITNEARSWEDVRGLVGALVLTMFWAGCIGAIAALGIWRPNFASAISWVTPDWILQTDYGETAAIRSVGDESWFFGIQFFRVNGLFLYSTMYAAALVVTIPVAAFAWSQARERIQRVLLGGVTLLLLLNLAGTTARMSIVGLLAGLTVYLSLYTRLRRPIAIALGGGVIVLVAATLVAPDWVDETASSLIYARGPNTVNSRSLVYAQTIQDFQQRPVFGWGTQRHVAGLPYGAGSHSYYLGVLYKQGAVGLLVFLAVWWCVWRDTRPPPTDSQAGDPSIRFLQIGRWVIVAALINALTEVLDLDATTSALLWWVLALLLATRLSLPSGFEGKRSG